MLVGAGLGGHSLVAIHPIHRVSRGCTTPFPHNMNVVAAEGRDDPVVGRVEVGVVDVYRAWAHLSTRVTV